MTKPLIIFGAGQIALLAHYYFSNDSDYTVAGFTVDAQFCESSCLNGLPLVEFEHIKSTFPPDNYDMFIAVSYSKLNRLRKEKYYAAKSLGYELASYISTKATILNNFCIGDNCFVLEDNTVQPFSTIGNNVTLWSGNHIGHHSSVGAHTFLASHVVVSGGVSIGEECFIGVNATLRDHISVGSRCIIGAGALMLEDAESDGVYTSPGSHRSKVPSNRIRHL